MGFVNVIQSEAEFLPVNIENPSKDLELIGKVCTAKEAGIASDTHIAFVRNLILRSHETVLEHRVMRVIVPEAVWPVVLGYSPANHNVLTVRNQMLALMHATREGRYMHVVANRHDEIEVFGNLHAWRDYLRKGMRCHQQSPRTEVDPLCDELLEVVKCKKIAAPFFFDLEVAISPHSELSLAELDLCRVEFRQEDSYTVRITCNRGVSHEVVRHRMALTQSSTRWIRYATLMFLNSPKVFGWTGLKGLLKTLVWKESLWLSAVAYATLLKLGCKPQEARNVLPNSMSTHVYVTGTAEEWHKFLRLRLDKTAHPEAREVAQKVREALQPYVSFTFDFDSPMAIDNHTEQTITTSTERV